MGWSPPHIPSRLGPQALLALYAAIFALARVTSKSWFYGIFNHLHAFQESIAVVLRCFVLFLVPNCNMWNSQHQSFAMAASLKKVHPTCAMTRGVLEEQKSPKIGRTPKPSKPHPVASGSQAHWPKPPPPYLPNQSSVE